jgi:hypothetical protein
MDDLANRLNAVLNGDAMPPPFGFILLTFDANKSDIGYLQSVSSIVPEDTIRILRQHADFLERQHRKQG